MYEVLALLALFVLLYSTFAGVVERSWVSGPIVFTLFGLLVGPFGLDLLTLETDRELIKALAELTLALVLFTDAAGAHIGVLEKSSGIPTRLLLLGLPLTILAGFGAGVLLLDNLSLFAIAVLATMLAPTDAALGKAVVTNPAVPDRIRQGLNVESGLNDGICVPILFVFLTLALDQAGEHRPGQLGLTLVASQIGIGLLVGVVTTFIAFHLIDFARRQKWLTPTWIQIPVIALALSCFSLAQLLGGSGFIAAFSGGLLFGILDARVSRKVKEQLLLASEGIGDSLALLTWVIFGSAVVGQVLNNFSWMVLAYAVLSLTVIRMLPVFLCLAGSAVDTEGKLFIGWFGPRGLASIVFAVIVIESDLPGSDTLVLVTATTIMLSILLHGITANPWATAYSVRTGKSK